MAGASLNGVQVIAGDVNFPLIGNWVAHVEIDTATAPTGSVTLRWLGTDLTGYVLRSGTVEQRTTVYVVGGAGGLDRDARAQEYSNEPALSVARQILADVGESLSNTATTFLRAQVLTRWVRLAGPAGDQLNALCDALEASWRVLPDGTVWIGQESWPAAEDVDGVVSGSEATLGVVYFLPENLAVLPGTTFQGEHIGAAVYELSGHKASGRAWAQAETPEDTDPLRAGLRALIREELRGVDYHALYPAAVVAQPTSGTVDLKPDAVHIPSLTRVPLRVPAPGAILSAPAAARVLLAWESGDPRRPVALASWEPGTSGKAVARVDDRTVGLTITATFAMGVLVGFVIVDATGQTRTFNAATPGPFLVRDKIAEGSPHLSLPAGSTV